MWSRYRLNYKKKLGKIRIICQTLKRATSLSSILYGAEDVAVGIKSRATKSTAKKSLKNLDGQTPGNMDGCAHSVRRKNN